MELYFPVSLHIPEKFQESVQKKSNYHLLSYFNCEIHNCLNKKIAQLKISIYSLLPQRTAIQILSPLGKDENGGEETN